MPDADSIVTELWRLCGDHLEGTAVPGVAKLKLPFSPLASGSAGAAKEAFLRVSSGWFEECAIWLGHDDADIAERIGESRPSGLQSDAPMWVLVASSKIPSLYGDLHRGAWGLFFSSRGGLSRSGPTFLTFDPVEALELTKQIGAKIGIISWHDDNAWLICVPG